MARTIEVIETEISKFESFKTEWTKPLFDVNITNRFIESTADGVVFSKLDDIDSWQSYDNFLLGNFNQFCIFELGEDNGESIIRSAYEIGNETIKDSGTGDGAVNKLQYWELNLFNNRGIASDLYTNDNHLTPYYPDHMAKYSGYAKMALIEVGDGEDPETFHTEAIIDLYMEAEMDDFVDCNILINSEIIIAKNSSTNLASDIPILVPLNGEDKVVPSGYNTSLREQIYTEYCDGMNWWFDETGEIASWHVGDQGIYTGVRKIVSSWQIYEWILSEIEELNREKTSLEARVADDIDLGWEVGELIDNAGLTKTFSQMFSEYPGIFDTVKLQYGFYTYVGDEYLNDENQLFQNYGYKSLESIKSAFSENQYTFNASADKMQSYFSQAESHSLSKIVANSDGTETTYTGIVTIWRLRYNDYLLAGAKHRYFISVYSLGMLVQWSEPCPWDGVIIFIVMVLVTYFLGPEAGVQANAAFMEYVILFSQYLSIGIMWASVLGIGSATDRRRLGYLAIAGQLYGGWQMAIKAEITASAKLGVAISKEMAARNVLAANVINVVKTLVPLFLESQKSLDYEEKEPENFEEEKDSKSFRKDRRNHEETLQFEPLERLMRKQEFEHNKINKQDLFDYRLKENYGGY